MGSHTGGLASAGQYEVPKSDVSPIQAAMNDLERTLARLADNVGELGEKLTPVRLFSPTNEASKPQSLAQVPNMSNIESAILELTVHAEKIISHVQTLRSEVRL